jgi:hypothetical protein
MRLERVNRGGPQHDNVAEGTQDDICGEGQVYFPCCDARHNLLVFDLAFSHSFCLRDVAWIHPVYTWTKRGDVGATSPTVVARQEPTPKQPKHTFASLQHHFLIIAQAWKGCFWATF